MKGGYHYYMCPSNFIIGLVFLLICELRFGRGGWGLIKLRTGARTGILFHDAGVRCVDGLYTLGAVLDSTVLDSYVLETSKCT
jgi:hypothetical protein